MFEKYTFPSDCVYNPPSKGGSKLTGQAEIVLERRLTEEEIKEQEEQAKQEQMQQMADYAKWAMTRVCNS